MSETWLWWGLGALLGLIIAAWTLLTRMRRHRKNRPVYFWHRY